MKVKGQNDVEMEVLMNEDGESVLVSLDFRNMEKHLIAEFNEHHINLIIKDLQSLAEEMHRNREHREFERLRGSGRMEHD